MQSSNATQRPCWSLAITLVLSTVLMISPLKAQPTDTDAIWWRGHTISETEPRFTPQMAAAGLYAETPVSRYFVQFSGPITPEMKAAVTVAGGELLSYVPRNTYIVRLDAAARSNVETQPDVLRVIPFSPQYRLAPALLEYFAEGASTAREQSLTRRPSAATAPVTPEEGNLTLTVLVFRDADLGRVVQSVETLGAKVLVQVPGERRSKLRVEIAADQLGDLARIEGIMWIEEYVLPTLQNDAARGVIQDAPVSALPNGLTGEGQIVAVADSGLDTGVDDASMHDDLEGSTTEIFSWPVQVGSGIQNAGADDGAGDLTHGHGTHVAASVLGNGTLSNGIYRGVAPEATLVFQALEQLTQVPDLEAYALTGIPADLNDLFLQAYDAGARIHTNSWGSEANFGSYSTESEDIDEFVWDHPDMFILFAGGNSGRDADGDNLVDADSITPQGTAKNVLTVGASENARPTIPQTYLPFDNGPTIDADRVADNPAGLAAFSSRGPTDDGRIKPDVVAPGTLVVSARSQAAPDTIWAAEDMEAGTNGWTATGNWGQVREEAHSGIFSWHDSPAGDYTDGANMTLRSPVWDIHGGGLGVKMLQFWCRFELGDGDRWVLDLSQDGGAHWFPVLTFTDTQDDWELVTFPLGGLLIRYSHSPQFRVRFRLVADSDGNTGDGVYIDDVRITEGAFGESLLSDQGLADPDSVSDAAYVMMSGTSMATPITAGSAAVVRQYLTEVLGLTDVSAALLRATFINGAADMSPGQYGTGAAQEITARPDTNQGWGRVDLANSIVPEAPTELEFVDESTGLETNDIHTYEFRVTDASVPVVITLVYHDFPGAGLVNDLDLTVETPTGNVLHPNGGTAPDRNNNVEQVLVSPAEAQLGIYSVTVTGDNVPEGPQPYALVMRYGGTAISGGQPDLTVSVSGPTSAAPGEDIGPLLNLMVQNGGEAPALGTNAAGADGYMVDVVLSADSVLPDRFAVFSPNFSEDVLLRSGRVSRTRTLVSGEQASYTVGAEIPADTPPGRYCVGLIVDPGKQIAESDEANNTVCHWLNVTDGAGTTSVSSGEAVTDSVSQGEWIYYRFDAPVSDTTLLVELYGLSDDVDLYVRRGSPPTLSSFDCRPYQGGTSDERCELANAGGSTWYAGVQGYHAGSYQLRFTSTKPLLADQEVAASVGENEWMHYRFEVPATATDVVAELYGLSGDADLYVRRGGQPTLTSFDCRPYSGGTSSETCRLDNSGTTSWYVSVHGYRAASFRLKVTVSGEDLPATLSLGEAVTGVVGLGEWLYYSVDVPAGTAELWVELNGLTADLDLYARRDSPPTLSSYSCRPYQGGIAPETCVIIPSTPATWYVGVHGYQAGSFRLRATAH